MSGRAITVPSGFIHQYPTFVPVYSDRNAARLPLYHRLDVSAKLKPKQDGINATLILGIYNLYARENPLGYEFNYDYLENNLKVYQYNFLRIFPNVSYVLTF